ncbi:MAG: CPBP family intramembrane metalloprotease [Candidatus Omnitrophica bacterium]|nr:CPBP family intramembrane metalloprotease [Candidatus Omnitrophota bacterium]
MGNIFLKSATMTSRAWLIFILAAIAGAMAWFHFEFPKASYVHLSVDRAEARVIASAFLKEQEHIDPRVFKTAVTFGNEVETDRYLQKAIGQKQELAFLERYRYELFHWSVRFFREGQKEEFWVTVDPRGGKVRSFLHSIDDTAKKPDMTLDDARALAQKTLAEQFGTDFSKYELKDEEKTRREQRVDYGFSWKHKEVDIPWSKEKDSGSARLLTGIVVSGHEVLSFYQADLDIPEKFSRSLDRDQELGRNLSMFFSLVYLLLVITAVHHVAVCRQHLVMHVTRLFFIRLAVVLWALMMLGQWNMFEYILNGFPTTQIFASYLMRAVTGAGVNVLFACVGLVIFALAGESFRFLARKEAGAGSVLKYVQSSFFSTAVASRIILGYLVACMMLGLQALLFAFGQKYCDVWSGQMWLTQFSSAYWPALAALTLAFRAALLEETVFRVYTTSRVFAWTKNGLFAIFMSAVIWGFGHSGYMVFPMWFRGVEVTILGLLLGVVYWRYGLIVVLVAHFLFDAFWGSAGCLWGSVKPLYFWSAWGVLVLPLLWAITAWLIRDSDEERPLEWRLGAAQKFHVIVLLSYMRTRISQGDALKDIQAACLQNGWDPAVVDAAIRDYQAEQR